MYGSDPIRKISALINPAAAITQLGCSVAAPDIWPWQETVRVSVRVSVRVCVFCFLSACTHVFVQCSRVVFGRGQQQCGEPSPGHGSSAASAEWRVARPPPRCTSTEQL